MTDKAALRKALIEAGDLGAVFEALGRLVWYDDHDREECPAEHLPTEAAIADALRTGRIQHEADGSTMDNPVIATSKPDRLTCVYRFRNTPAGLAQDVRVLGPLDAHEEWAERYRAGLQHKHPLAALVRIWQNRPPSVVPNLRPDRIIPSKLAIVSGQAADRDGRRTGGRLFTPAGFTVQYADGQLVLPSLELEGETLTGPCLPLTLYDLGAGSVEARRSRSAPLALRIFIEAVLAAPLDRRDIPVHVAITWRDFLARLWPHGAPKGHGRRYEALEAAADALGSGAARIPWEYNGRGGRRQVVALRDIPRGPGHLDDLVQVTVDLPPGSGNGPIVSPRLHEYGVRSAPAYRTLLNLAYAWHDPGRLLVPTSKQRGAPWTPVEDPDLYPGMTDREIIALCFPTSSTRNRRVLARRAREVLEGLTADGEIQIRKGRLLPPKRKK